MNVKYFMYHVCGRDKSLFHSANFPSVKCCRVITEILASLKKVSRDKISRQKINKYMIKLAVTGYTYTDNTTFHAASKLFEIRRRKNIIIFILSIINVEFVFEL